MFEQHFYIADRFMGSVVRHEVQVHNERHTPMSIGHFCKQCATVWAKAPVTPHRAWDLKWSLCPNCNEDESEHIAGSMLSTWDHTYNALLLSCDSIVRWELQCHLDFIERRIAND